MGERAASRRRVLIEDARRDGHHLRTTWHPENRQFVVSTWHDDVCTGATRVAVEDVAALTGLLVAGLAETAAAEPIPPPGPAHPFGAWAARARAWLRRTA
ncbi:MAG TPA: hypothetical protein VFM27_17920 [Acidimicrobiales bacterium]|nr:hypothetical protein [Acidimicrobiales bacterium]